MTHKTSLFAAIAVSLCLALPAADAAAQEIRGKQAGDFNVRLRGIAVVPDNAGRTVFTAGGAATANTLDRASTAMAPEIDFSYFITPNIALELIAATTRHDLTLNGGTLKLGSTGVLPPTLTVQYHLLPRSTFSPYVGAGLNYTVFYGESNNAQTFNGLKLKDAWGWALQGGIDVLTSGPISLNFDVKKIFLKTEATVNQNPSTALKVTDIKLNPWVIGAGVGYRF